MGKVLDNLRPVTSGPPRKQLKIKFNNASHPLARPFYHISIRLPAQLASCCQKAWLQTNCYPASEMMQTGLVLGQSSRRWYAAGWQPV